MYCIKCGVELAESEKICPLCDTLVYHPDFTNDSKKFLFPPDRMPPRKKKSNKINGVILILFLIPVFITLISDLQIDGQFNWFDIAFASILLGYIILALPLWFKKPNPVIFIPCDFVAVAVFLLYISFITNGSWFMSFAFPIVAAAGVIITALVSLIKYLKNGILYIWGGCFISFGLFILLVEFLLYDTFEYNFIGWSLYPMIVLVVLGCMLIYLAINGTARDTFQRKLFF